MAGIIKPIENQTVHRICSGQVVLTLALAVKELIENSLDASATVIDIRLKEYGSEQIEVVDNGRGIEEKNFEGIALKHYTSKLSAFSDLVSVETYGFRGEALSSLCALSDVSVTTCYKESANGFCLRFDHDGVLVDRTPCARQVGTTVCVRNLFASLPVRHKEFLHHLKREFGKMVHMLTAYCLVCQNVRITCINQVGGRKTTVLTTHGSSNIRENIINVYGSKQFSTLLEFRQVSPTKCIQEEYYLSVEDGENLPFRLNGFVSSCEHAKGRSVADRQFFYINDRPCDLPKVSRLVNEVYHSFNRHQNPFVLLSISLKKDAVDINVTPDKRQIFIQHEKLLLATLKTSLLQLFEPLPALTESILLKSKVCSSYEEIHSRSQDQTRKRKSFEVVDGEENVEETEVSNKKGPFTKIMMKVNTTHCNETTSENIFERNELKKSENDEYLTTVTPLTKLLQFQRNPGVKLDTSTSRSKPKKINEKIRNETIKHFFMPSDTKDCVSERFCIDVAVDGCLTDPIKNECVAETSYKESDTTILEMEQDCKSSYQTSGNALENLDVSQKMVTQSVFLEELITSETEEAASEDISLDDGVSDSSSFVVDEPSATQSKPNVTIQLSLEELRKQISTKGHKMKQEDTEYHLFRARINPSENDSAEDELRKELRKDSFSQMEVLGQFNLGFIIAKLGSDLFIVDQHATDEKYNYEMLQANTVLETQKLVIPQTLHLTVVNESLLLENVDIFKRNGFHFEIDETGNSGRKVKLVSVPISRNWTFGKEDIDELLFMLSDSPGVMCRPSRVSQMFASRACRKSVMIGTALAHADMKKLLIHMGEIEQPWNCPHGRPTIRHLISLDMLGCETPS